MSMGFGIIGCGSIAKWHALGIAACPDAALAGVVDSPDISCPGDVPLSADGRGHPHRATALRERRGGAAGHCAGLRRIGIGDDGQRVDMLWRTACMEDYPHVARILLV